MAGLVPAISFLAARWPVLRLPIRSRGRRLDDDRLAGIDHGGIGPLELLHVAVLAPYSVLANLAGLAAGKAERTHATVARQNGAIHLFQKTNSAAHAVARIPAAVPARTFADVEILEHDPLPTLDPLRTRPSHVGHARVPPPTAPTTPPPHSPAPPRLV